MKKTVLVTLALIACLSCAREQVTESPVETDRENSVRALAADFEPAVAEVKTTITQIGSEVPNFSWKEGDVLGVIPMDNATMQSNYTLKEIGQDPKTALFDGGVWTLREGKRYAAYYPFKKVAADSKDCLTFSFEGQKQDANDNLEHLGDYDYMYATAVAPEDKKATFCFSHLVSLVRLQLTVPVSDKIQKLVLESEGLHFVGEASLALADGTVTALEKADSFTLDLNDVSVEAGGTLIAWMSMLPTDALADKTIGLKLFGASTVCAGSVTTGEAWCAGKAYSYSATLKKDENLILSLAGATSSTLAFKWTVDGVTEGSHKYAVALYSDPNGENQLYRFDFAADAFNKDTGSGFTFSGLESGREYWCRVYDTTEGCRSIMLSARTEQFNIVTMPHEIVSPGIVLAEDFGELRWDCDIHYQCAGLNPGNRNTFATYIGTYKRCGTADSIPMEEDMLYNQTSALPGSRLERWASEGNVYIRPGMLELGKNKSGSTYYKGFLLTPEFNIPGGRTATVNVSITASSLSNTESNAWVIAVLDRENANVTGYKSDFDHHPSGSASIIQSFTFEKAGKWYKFEAKGLAVKDGDRIMFGPKASYKPSGANTKTRVYVNDVTASVASLSGGTLCYEDPLVFRDGRKVTAEAEWAGRRAEILDIFQHEEYGRMPEPGNIYVEKVEGGNTTIPKNSVSGTTADQPAVREQYRMWFRADHTGPKIDWLVVRPANASGPVPVIMTLNYWGNHQMLDDTQVLVPTEDWFDSGDTEFGVANNRISSSSRGILLKGDLRYHYPLDLFISKGYAFVTACCADVAADPEANGDDVSLQKDLPFRQIFTLWGPRDFSKGENTGVLAAWGWSLMRGMDMIEQLGSLDKDKVLVTGCSRLGKAALIAAAFDERFSICAPVQTGSGGVPLTKHPHDGKESVESETRSYTHWWCDNFRKYANNEAAMPFDQHMLVSCVAPRGIMVSGYDKDWFDPEGEFLSLKYASPVWEFLGKAGMPDVSYPADNANNAIGTNMGYYHRPIGIGHGANMSEWNRILPFAANLWGK